MKYRATVIFGIIFSVVVLGIGILVPKQLLFSIIFGEKNCDDYKIFHSREIENGTPQAWKESENMNEGNILDNHRLFMEENETTAFLIVQNNEIVYEEYWEKYTQETFTNSFSMSNAIISILVGIAIDEGKILSENQKVGDFIPQFATGDLANISIKDLLTMSSGLNWNETETGLTAPMTEIYYGADLKDVRETITAKSESGKNFEYQSINTQILAYIIQNATGMKVSHYAERNLWKKIGAENIAFWSLDHKQGDEKAFCCFNSTVRDFARIGQLILNLGKWNNTQIVSEKYLMQSIQPVGYISDSKGQAMRYYGYHWWILHYKEYSIPFVWGEKGQFLFVIPEENAVVVRIGNHCSDKMVNDLLPLDLYTYVDAAIEVIKNTNE